jgi:glutathione-specific gamma-glutamylcyclotransferase
VRGVTLFTRLFAPVFYVTVHRPGKRKSEIGTARQEALRPKPEPLGSAPILPCEKRVMYCDLANNGRGNRRVWATQVHAPILTRSLIETGEIDAIVAKDAPALRLLTEAEREASLQTVLASRPPGDVWLFGYGSLIWNPTIRIVERRIAQVAGWHRAFCLSTMAGRGSAESPGLVLALDAEGTCTGVAFRIAEANLESELTLLWRREMLCGAYVPRWVDVRDREGARFGSAIAFTIDPMSDHYAGGLTVEAVVRRLATASGVFGSAADYLFRTCDGLRAHGIADAELDLLATRVEAAQALNCWT